MTIAIFYTIQPILDPNAKEALNAVLSKQSSFQSASIVSEFQ
jgi:hypothetical protein